MAILAAYNLEDSIAGIIKRTYGFVDRVIVVADGSSDNTAKKARESDAITPEPTMKRGKGYAVIKGIQASKEYLPDVIILMDADGQHLPEEIPNLVKPIIEEDVDMVVGSRMMGELRTSFVNRVGNMVLKVISFLVTGKRMSDTESGFRAFKANKLYGLRLASTGYEIESELLLRALKNKLKVREIPITVPYAKPGVTIKDGIKNGWYKIHKGLQIRFGIEK